MKKPLKDVLALFIGDAGVRVAGFLISIYLARVLEPSAFGIMNIGLSVLAYLMLLGSPGIQMLEMRNVAAAGDPDVRRVNAVLSLRLILAVILLLITAIVTSTLPLAAPMRATVILFCMSLIPLSLFLDWFFQGRERFGIVSAARLVSHVVYGVLVLILVRSAMDTIWVPVGFAAGNLAAALLLIVSYRQSIGGLVFSLEPSLWKEILISNLPVGFSMFLAQSAVNLPPIVLGWLVLTADAGVFSAAMKIILVLLILDRVLNALLLPAAARIFATRAEEAPFLLAVVMKIVLLVSVPLGVCGILFSPAIVALVFGEEYADAVPILQILFGYFFLTLLNSVFVCTLVGARREKEYSRAINAGSVVFLVAIVIGTLLLGTQGAAYAVCLGELVTVILMASFARKAVTLPSGTVGWPLLAGAVMAATVIFFNGWHIALQALAGFVSFSLVATVSKTLRAKEIHFLRERFV